MNTAHTEQELLRDALRELAGTSAQPLPGLTDRVLRTRRRRRLRRTAGLATAVTTVVLSVALLVPGLSSGSDADPSALPQQDIVAQPDQSPPRGLIAAGDVALSAYSMWEAHADGEAKGRVWSLYDPRTQRYAKTAWAWLDVAPGMRTAAVLEGPLPAKRIGLLDLDSGKVTRWITLPGDGVGSVQWSPDGKRLLATAYRLNPDGRFRDSPIRIDGKERPGPKDSRTGFYVVGAESGHTSFAEVTRAEARNTSIGGHTVSLDIYPDGRDDFAWSRDAKAVWAAMSTAPGHMYFDLTGKRIGVPRAEKFTDGREAGLSPDGRLSAGASPEDGVRLTENSPSRLPEAGGSGEDILDARTGRKVAHVPGEQLLAWADNRRLIAWDCEPGRCSGAGEYRNRLVVVTLGSEKEIPLSGFKVPAEGFAEGGVDTNSWVPVFTRR